MRVASVRAGSINASREQVYLPQAKPPHPIAPRRAAQRRRHSTNRQAQVGIIGSFLIRRLRRQRQRRRRADRTRSVRNEASRADWDQLKRARDAECGPRASRGIFGRATEPTWASAGRTARTGPRFRSDRIHSENIILNLCTNLKERYSKS